MVKAASVFALLVGSTAASPGLSPPNTSFSASGGMTLVRNGPNGQSDIWVCNMSIYLSTGAPSAANASIADSAQLTSAALTGLNCDKFEFNGPTFSPTAITITSITATGGSAILHGLTILYNKAYFCNGGSSIPFTWTNNGASPSTMDFQTAPIYPPSTFQSCYLSGKFTTSPDINAVQ